MRPSLSRRSGPGPVAPGRSRVRSRPCSAVDRQPVRPRGTRPGEACVASAWRWSFYCYPCRPAGPVAGRVMPGVHLLPAERQALLGLYRASSDPDIRLRAHILLLLDAGHPWATVSAILICSVSTISRWKWRFDAEGVDAVYGRLRGRRRSGVHVWAAVVVQIEALPVGRGPTLPNPRGGHCTPHPQFETMSRRTRSRPGCAVRAGGGGECHEGCAIGYSAPSRSE
jgi:hypothetical protein